MKSGLVRYGPNSAEVGSPHGTGFRIIALLTNINLHDSFPLLQPTQKTLHRWEAPSLAANTKSCVSEQYGHVSEGPQPPSSNQSVPVLIYVLGTVLISGWKTYEAPLWSGVSLKILLLLFSLSDKNKSM